MKKALLLILNFNLIIIISYSQSTIDIVQEKEIDTNNHVIFAKFLDNNTYASKPENEIKILEQLNQPSNDLSYKKEREYKDDLGFTHKIYKQYYKEIEVTNAGYVLHIKDNSITYLNGKFCYIDKRDTIAKIDISDAEQYLITQLKIQNKIIIDFKEMVFYENNNEMKLAYKFFVQSLNPNIDAFYYIDAVKRELLGQQTLAFNVNSNGTAQTSYSGSQNFVTDSYGSQYRLKENRNGVIITTLNLNDYNYQNNNGMELLDNNNSWTQVELEKRKYALDLHWAAEKTLDYWRIVQNRNSFNDSGREVKNFINNGPNIYFPNARWAGSISAIVFDNSNIGSFHTTLDMYAHEFAHAVCYFTSRLTYNKESGALNEGFSDIWGAVVENWAMPNSPPKDKWLIAEELSIISNASYFFRSLKNPKQYSQPNTYLGQYWYNTNNCVPDPIDNDFCGVHTNSGVLNYWFYLLSEGGCNTNDIGNKYYVLGIGMDKAAKIAYRTEQLLHSSDGFSMARTMSIQAAQELYGVNSDEVKSVTQAWYAVGVGANFTGSIFTINGASSICSSTPQNFSINNLPSGATVVWSRTPTNTTTLTQVNNIATITKTANGLITLTATITTQCSTYTATKNINVGLPYFSWTIPTETQAGASSVDEFECSDVSNPMCYSAGSNGQKNWSTSSLSNYTSASWSKVWSIPSSGSGIIWSGTTSGVNVHFKAMNKALRLKTTLTNACGSAEQYYCFHSTNVACPYDGPSLMSDCKNYDVSINSTTKQVQIVKSNNNCDDEIASMKIKNIQIVDKMGNVVKEQNYQTDKTNIYEFNLNETKNDIYFVLIQYNDFVETHQIAIF